MSNKLLDAAWQLTLPPLEKFVLISLACRADSDGKCWPSIGDTARRTSASERTVQRAMRALKTKGHLTIETRPGTTPMYTVHPRQSDTPAPVTQTPPQASDSRPTPATQTHHPRQSDTQTIKNHHESSGANLVCAESAEPRLVEVDFNVPPATNLTALQRALAGGLAVDREGWRLYVNAVSRDSIHQEMRDWAADLNDAINAQAKVVPFPKAI